MKVFDGRKTAEEILQSIKEKNLKTKTHPKLVSIVAGDQKGALFYQNLKKKKAEEVGIKVNIKKYPENVEFEKLKSDIQKINKDHSCDGVMIQLPLPKNLKSKTCDLIQCIESGKDVDGMRDDSEFTSPVVKSVIKAFKEAVDVLGINSVNISVLVIGHTGFEGGMIYKALKELVYKVSGANKKTANLKQKTKKADVIISATGVQDLVKADMVKEGVVLIDVGSPKGDIEKSAYEKASFVSPVPGGVGPCTISYLMENIYEASLGKD